MKVALIYHFPCNDGLMCAALAVRHFAGDQQYLFPTAPHERERHQEILDKLAGINPDVVWIMDVCLYEPVMYAIANMFSTFWFDHHESARELFGRFNGRQDANMAACELVWHHLHTEEIALPVKLIAEYDTFRNPRRKEFHSMVIPFQCMLEQLRHLAVFMSITQHNSSAYIDKLIWAGQQIWDREQVDFQDVKFKRETVGTLDGKTYRLAITGDIANAGRAAYLLRRSNEQSDFMVTQRQAAYNKYTYSIRSIRPGADCLQFIESMGLKGGGHIKAAGFSTEIPMFYL